MRKDICELIRNDIIHLRLKPGEPLNEIKLAKEFDVSRTPVREALRRLAAEGLVTITPNLGARVSEVNLRDFRELIEYRIILERGVASLVASNSTEEDLLAMRQLYERMQSQDLEDIDRLIELDSEFHRIIRRAAHNQLLEKQMEITQLKFQWLMRAYHYKSRFTMLGLPDVIEAVEKRDSITLESILLDHFAYFIEKLNEDTMGKF